MSDDIKLPSTISGDGRTFVSLLLSYLKSLSGQVREITSKVPPGNIKSPSAREVWVSVDGVVKNSVQVIYDSSKVKDFAYVEIYVKVGDKDFTYLDNTSKDYMYYDVENGETYTFKLLSVNSGGLKSDINNAPTCDITVTGVRQTISFPYNATIEYNKKGTLLRWDGVTDVDFLEYEIRKDSNLENINGLLGKTKETSFYLTGIGRVGTIYIYSKNNSGGYSEPLAISYNKPFPYAPKNVIITKPRENVVIQFSNIPDDCIGANIYINGTPYFVRDNVYEENMTEQIVTMQVAYVDAFGDGNRSDLFKVEPPNVTGLTISASSLDRSSVTLRWNPISNVTYEIRLGDSWSTATLIAKDVRESYYEYKLSSEGYKTFLIKAVNQLNYTSALATSLSGMFVLKPDTPTNASVVQSISDKSIFTVSWDSVSGNDIKEYEVRLGNTWDTGSVVAITKEKSCKCTIVNGGIYNIMVIARTVAGFESGIRNVSFVAYTKPSNVSGFMVSASPIDRRVLNFKWNPVTDQDLLCYEIRQGATWDSSTLVAANIKSNFCNVDFAGGNAMFLIKAVNISGNYSDVVATTTIIISVTPNAPGAGSIISDPSNRLALTIQWEAVTDTDLQGYEIRKGDFWDTATLVNITKENMYMYTVSTGGTHTFLIASKTIGGKYSLARTLSISINNTPYDVPTLVAAQNDLDRRIINLSWGAVADSDVDGYELRKGTSWDTATLVASGVKALKYDYTSTASESATFLIKAVTVGGIYSSNARTANITIKLEPSNITSGNVSQDVTNSSAQILTWNSIADKDLQYYEIRLGSVFASATILFTTKELRYVYNATSNSQLTFWIVAKNIGGYYSSVPFQILCTPNLNPYDVTGFSVTQLVSDHSKIRLSWNAVSNRDFSYYEIREGATWDTGVIVATRLTSLIYDASISSERTYTYWIKAFNVAGASSQNPVSAYGLFSMSPTIPSGLTVSTDINDKTKLNISWNPIGDQDLKEYELRVGATWNDAGATVISTTKETKSVYYPPSSDSYHFMLVSRNNSNFSSDIVETSYVAYIEPSDVPSLQAMQNGTKVLLSWGKVAETDVAGYEIRDGSSFDNGSLVITGISYLSYQVPVDTEKTYRYWIKAINRAGKYSQNAASAEVTIAGLPSKNIIFSYDEVALKNGTATNVEFGTSLINMSNIGGRFSDYPNTKFSDIGGQTVLKLKQINLLDTSAKRKPLVYNNYSANMTATITPQGTTYKGEPVYRLTITPTNTSGVTQLATNEFGHGFQYMSEKISYLLNTNYYSSVYWKLVSAKPVTMSGTPANISGWSNIGTSINSDGWNRTTSRRYHSTTQSDYKYFSIMCPTVTLNESVIIDICCPQIEVGDTPTEFGSYFSSGEYTVVRKDMGRIITANITSQFVSTILYTSGVNTRLQYRTSRDGTNFTDWADFQSAQTTFQYIDFKTVLSTTDVTKTPEVNQFTILIDVPDDDNYGSATIPVGGATVSFGKTYYSKVGNPALTVEAIGEGKRADLISMTYSDFFVKVKDASGTDVGGTITWISRGF